jgi:hypothetical protein
MVVLRKLVPALLMSLAFALAGCTDGGGETNDGGGDSGGGEAPPVVATSTTGGIRGVVVDERITPIKGALIEVTGSDKNVTTGEDGLFAISGLEAGTYFVRASHPLFAAAQQSVDVVAGEENPESKRILLTRTVFAEPYMQTLQYDGFIVCSVNLVVVLSEECGEGVGVPDEECVPVTGPCVPIPPPGGTRVGGQANNNVQFDFTIGAGAQTVIVEKVWEYTSEAGKALYSPISTEWSCLPSCSGNGITSMDGESPLYASFDNATILEEEIVPDVTIISVFTWASPSYTGAVANQKYTDYVSVFYYVPAPEGWSFVAGDSDPFK